MKLHTTTLPCLFSLLCRRSLLQQCRVCSFQTYAPNPPGNTTYNTTYNTTPTRPARESGFKGAYAPRTLADREQQRFAQDEVNKYIYKLEAGELFDGDKWEQIFTKGSRVDVHQSSQLLKFAREAKILTPHRYFLLLSQLLDSNEIVPAQLALNTMMEDEVRLSNWQCVILARKSVAEYTLFLRIISLMDLDAWDYPLTIPRLAETTKLMLGYFEFTGRGVNNGTNLGHLMHMIPHMSPQVLEAMATSTELPNELTHAYAYTTRTGLLPTMKMYQHFAKFLPLPLLAAMYQQMRSRGLIPNAEMYSNMLLRFKSEPASDFRLQLANDMRLHNYKHTSQVGFTILDIYLQAEQYEKAFEVFQKLLEGPFTQEEYHIVTQTISKFTEQFQGTPFEEKASTMMQETLQTPPNQLITPPANILQVIDDEW